MKGPKYKDVIKEAKAAGLTEEQAKQVVEFSEQYAAYTEAGSYYIFRQILFALEPCSFSSEELKQKSVYCLDVRSKTS